jgi:hypothetical protein
MQATLDSAPDPQRSTCKNDMSTNFTKKGGLFKFEAHKDDPSYYAILPQDIIGLCNDIQDAMAAINQVPGKSKLARAALGCFDRFNGCIMCIWRISRHEEAIKAMAPTAVGQMVGLRGAEILIDFESLLFHSRSSLDRVAFFVAKQIHNQDCDKYPKFVNVLKNFQQKDSRASKLIEVITVANPMFEGILFDDHCGKKSLRSHLIHKSTASENTRSLFTLHRIVPDKRIAFDSILGDYAILKTSQILGQGLAFVALNALSLYLNLNHTLTVSDFKLRWESQMVDYRDFLSERPDAERFIIFNTDPSGCSLSPVPLSPEILNRAY